MYVKYISYHIWVYNKILNECDATCLSILTILYNVEVFEMCITLSCKTSKSLWYFVKLFYLQQHTMAM